MKEIQKIGFKYEGRNQVNMDTFIASQMQYLIILTEIKDELFPELKLNIKIESFEKGSFDVVQTVELVVKSGILSFATNHKDCIDMIFFCFRKYIELKKLLNGKKADNVKEIDDERISLDINGNHNIIYKPVYNLYTGNVKVHKAFQYQEKILENDEEIKGIQINNSEKNKNHIYIPRNDFHYLGMSNPYIDEKEFEELELDNIYLHISSINFEIKSTSKWNFEYKSEKLKSVKILDKSFLDKVHKGLKFGSGDQLRCKLKVIKKKDENGDYINYKYEILEVYEVIEAPKYINMF